MCKDRALITGVLLVPGCTCSETGALTGKTEAFMTGGGEVGLCSGRRRQNNAGVNLDKGCAKNKCTVAEC